MRYFAFALLVLALALSTQATSCVDTSDQIVREYAIVPASDSGISLPGQLDTPLGSLVLFRKATNPWMAHSYCHDYRVYVARKASRLQALPSWVGVPNGVDVLLISTPRPRLALLYSYPIALGARKDSLRREALASADSAIGSEVDSVAALIAGRHVSLTSVQRTRSIKELKRLCAAFVSDSP